MKILLWLMACSPNETEDSVPPEGPQNQCLDITAEELQTATFFDSRYILLSDGRAFWLNFWSDDERWDIGVFSDSLRFKFIEEMPVGWSSSSHTYAISVEGDLYGFSSSGSVNLVSSGNFDYVSNGYAITSDGTVRQFQIDRNSYSGYSEIEHQLNGLYKKVDAPLVDIVHTLSQDGLVGGNCESLETGIKDMYLSVYDKILLQDDLYIIEKTLNYYLTPCSTSMVFPIPDGLSSVFYRKTNNETSYVEICGLRDGHLWCSQENPLSVYEINDYLKIYYNRMKLLCVPVDGYLKCIDDNNQIIDIDPFCN